MLFSISCIIAFLVIILLVPYSYSDLENFTNIHDLKETYSTPSSLGIDKISNIKEFNFGAAGDWGCTPDTIKTLENTQDKSPEFVLALGDLSYEDAPQCWLDIINPIENKTLIAIGNHDDETPEKLKEYMDYFGLEQQYYSFNYENMHFIAISTEIPFNEESSQYNFVSNDLADASMNPNIDWIVVFYHTLAYTSPADIGKGNSADKELRNTYHPLFDKYHVDLVLQAHNHNYQRSYPIIYNNEDPKNPVITDKSKDNYINPKGIVFSTIGTGGAEAYPLTGQARYIVAQYVGFGFLNVDVINNGETLNGKYYANDGSIKDQFTITKTQQ
jgi:hypothetical protein